MAKTKQVRSAADPKPEPASIKREEKLAMLRKYYALGQRASDTAPDGTPKQAERIKDLAAEAGVDGGTIRLALRFAASYTPSELGELLEVRTKRGEPLGWYLVRVLLQIDDKSQRAELQKRAAQEGWSRDDLQDAVNATQGSRRRERKGGRKYALPRSPGQTLRRLVEVSESWLRFYETVGGEGGIDVQLRSAALSDDRAPDLKDLVQQVRDRLGKVQEEAGKVAEQLRKWERKLKTEGKEDGATPNKTVDKPQAKARPKSPPKSQK